MFIPSWIDSSASLQSQINDLPSFALRLPCQPGPSKNSTRSVLTISLGYPTCPAISTHRTTVTISADAPQPKFCRFLGAYQWIAACGTKLFYTLGINGGITSPLIFLRLIWKGGWFTDIFVDYICPSRNITVQSGRIQFRYHLVILNKLTHVKYIDEYFNGGITPAEWYGFLDEDYMAAWGYQNHGNIGLCLKINLILASAKRSCSICAIESHPYLSRMFKRRMEY